MNEKMIRATKEEDNSSLIAEIEEYGYCQFSETYTEKIGLAKQETRVAVYELNGKTYLLKYVNGKNVVFHDITAKSCITKNQIRVECNSNNMYFNCYKSEAYSYTDKNFATIEEVKEYLHVENITFYVNNCGELEAKIGKWRVTVKMEYMTSEGEGYVSMLEESGALESYYDE